MSKKTWIIVLVAAGVGLAVVIGVLGNSDNVAEAQYCSSLESLQSDITALTSLDPSTASQGQFQSDVSAIQSDWDDVKSDAQNLSSANQSDLDSAWNSFENAVKGIPDNASVSDAEQAVPQSAQGLQTAAQS